MARRRQVIELPPPPPIEVTEHVVYHGWCSQCQQWREAPVDVSAEVLGQGRLGVKITSLIAYLRTVMPREDHCSKVTSIPAHTPNPGGQAGFFLALAFARCTVTKMVL